MKPSGSGLYSGTARHGRALASLVAFLTLGLALATGGDARDQKTKHPSGRMPLGANHPDPERAAADRRKLKELRAERESDEAKADRRRSRTAYAGQTGAEALATVRAKFGRLIEEPVWRAEDVATGHGIERYLNDYAAQVDLGPGREVGLVETTNPLRTLGEDGRRVPVDLTLEDRGGSLAPKAPQVALEIDDRASGGFAFDRAGVRVRVAGAEGSATVVEDKAIFANSLRDTDLLVMPTVGGAQAFFTVRSAESPEQATLQFDLPPGAQLHPDGAGAKIVAGGRTVAEIQPPLAADADGTPVPVSYRLAGDQLVVGFAHRDRDVRYPIMVDPNIVFAVKEVYGGGWPGAWSDPNGWVSSQSGPHWWNHAFVGGSGGGLDISGSFSPYDYNEWRQWAYEAPPNSYIYRAELQSSHSWYWTCIDEGLWAFQNNWNWQQLHQPAGCGGSYSHHWITACSEANCSPGATYNYDRNFAVHSLRNAYGPVVQPDTTWTRLEAANLFLRDSNQPRFTAFSGNHPSSGWVKNGTYFVDTTTVDDGLGMYMVEMANNTGSGFSVEKKFHGCTGDRHSRCPATWGTPAGTSWSPRFTYNADSQPEGVNWYSLTAWDAVANRSAEDKIWALAIDRTAPTIQDPTGTLWDRRNRTDDKRFQGLYDASYSMSVHANGEGSNTTDPQRRSGVKKIDIEVVNAATGAVERSHPDPTPQACPTSSCTKTRPFTFLSDTYTDGEKIIRIKAYDQVDNFSTREFRVTVDRRGDIYRAEAQRRFEGGSLENSVEPQWSRLGTRSARQESSEWIITRTTMSQGGDTWDEVRYVARPTDYADDPADPANNGEDPYAVERGEGDDPNLDEPAEIQSFREDFTGATPARRGTLESALETWQVPPPAHGRDYLAFDQTGTFAGEDEEEEQVVVTTFVDETTRYPLKQQMKSPAGATLMTLYWTYAVSRLELSEVPGNFFAATPPPQPGMTQDIEHGGATPIGAIQDVQTGTMFTPRALSATVTTSLGTFQLTETDVVHQTTGPQTAQEALDFEPPVAEPGAEPDPDPDTAEDALPPGEDDVFTDTMRPDAGAVEPVTSAHVYYRQTAGTTLDPEETRDPLWVSTMARTSAEAQGWRDVYTEHATAIQMDPTDPEFLESGPFPVLIGLEPAVAYVLVIDDEISSALLDLGEVTVIIEGKFKKTDLPLLVSSLRGF